MKRHPVPILPKDELQAWPTKRLLGRLHSLRILEEAPELSDMTRWEAQEWTSGKIGFKSEPEWHEAYQDIKDILAKREHVED